MIKQQPQVDQPCGSSADSKAKSQTGFAFPEVCIAVGICIIFGAAAFAANQRLLSALKSQKETTAATMMLQERMEKFRGGSYSQVTENPANPDPNNPSAHWVRDSIVAIPTASESALGTVSETITVSGYQASVGPSPAPSATPSDNYSQWVRSGNYPTGNQVHHDDNLVTQFDLVKVDIQVNWTTMNGRTRTRSTCAIFGKGNIGQ